jgi:hypothetical protein
MTGDDALLPPSWFAVLILHHAGAQWRDKPCPHAKDVLTWAIFAAYRAGLDCDVIEWAAGIRPWVRASLVKNAEVPR